MVTAEGGGDVVHRHPADHLPVGWDLSVVEGRPVLASALAHIRIAQQFLADLVAVDRPGQHAARKLYLDGRTQRTQLVRLGVNVFAGGVQYEGTAGTHSFLP